MFGGRSRGGCQLVALFCALLATGTEAAVTHDPDLVWRTLATGHFQIHFHQADEPLARRVAALAERVHARLVPRIGWTPVEPVDVVLDNRQDLANGFASTFPYDQITLNFTAPDGVDGLEDYDNWLELLFTHEYVHILHIDRADGLPADLRRIFGRNSWLFPNALQPRWLIEGLATWNETDRARGVGRGQSSYFDMLMRTEVAHGVKPLRQINQPISSWPGGLSPYLYGVSFFDFLEDRYGEERIRLLIDHYSDNLVPFRINANSESVLGGDLDRQWADFNNYLQERHGTRLAAIRQSGVVAGESVTHDGYYSGVVQVLPSGDLIYIQADGRDEPALFRIHADGHRQRLTAVQPIAHLAVHPRAGALLAQPEVFRNSSTIYDLYRVDLDNGHMTRLTRGGRYRYATWSPDGTRILAVHNAGDHHALHLLDAEGRKLEELWTGTANEVLSEPDWSPDGHQVVLGVWRAGSGWNLERFDLAGRQFTRLTSDAAIEGHPHHTADNRGLLFTSDHGGVYNLRHLDFASGRVTTLTNVEGGAFHPVQAGPGTPIYYTGYSARGFDLYRLERPASLPTPPPPDTRPAFAAATTVAEPAVDSGIRDMDYSPYDHLRPRWWLPHIFVDSLRTEVGAITSAWDPLRRHLYFLDAAYDVRNEWVVGSLDYIYDRYQPTFKLHAARSTNLYQDAYGNTVRSSSAETYLAEVAWPWLTYRRTLSAQAAAYTVRDHEFQTAPGYLPFPDRSDNVVGYALVYDSTRRYPLSVSRSHGVALRVTVETSDAIEGSDYSGEVYSFDGRAFLPLGDEHVLAIRAAYGWGTGRPRPFVLGGSRSGGETPLPLDPPLVSSPFNQREMALRGYDSGQPGLVGRRMMTGSVEWRFPLARIERGFMAPPVAIHQLSGIVFAETGDAWDDGSHPNELVSSAGAEIKAETFVIYDFPLTLRLGYAHGYAATGTTQLYLQLGSSF